MAAAVVAAAAGVSVISSVAAGSSNASSFVPITPCRLFDTRPAADNIGPRAIPLGPGDVFTVDTWGTNGNCTIPTGATALSLNVVAIGPTASSYLTVYPGGNARPTASSLNWTAGQAPTPNAVTAALNGTGQLSFYNLAGSVNIAADVVGYYEPSTSGPAGATGPAGPQGSPGVDPANIIWVASSGGDFTTISAALASITDNDATHRYVIKLAPGTYTENAGIDMKNYVDIEGSGPSSTISANGSGTAGAAVRFAGSLVAELRDVTVASTGGRGVVFTTTGAVGDARLSDARVSVSGTTLAEARAVALDGGRATIDGVEASVTGGAFTKFAFHVSNSSTVVITDSTATTLGGSSPIDCYGVDVFGSTVTLVDVSVTVTGCGDFVSGVRIQDSTATVDQARVSVSSLSGAVAQALVVFDSTATLDRVSAVTSGAGVIGNAFWIDNSTAIVRDSRFEGTTNSVNRWSGDIQLIDSQVLGPTSGMSGRCASVFDTSNNSYSCA